MNRNGLYTLINVHRYHSGQVTGSFLQHHVGTLQTATQAAMDTEKANGHQIDVAVIPYKSSPTAMLDDPFTGNRLDDPRWGQQ